MPLLVTQDMSISAAAGCGRAIGLDTALSGGWVWTFSWPQMAAQTTQYDPQWQHGTRISTWFQVADKAPHIGLFLTAITSPVSPLSALCEPFHFPFSHLSLMYPIFPIFLLYVCSLKWNCVLSTRPRGHGSYGAWAGIGCQHCLFFINHLLKGNLTAFKLNNYEKKFCCKHLFICLWVHRSFQPDECWEVHVLSPQEKGS